MFANSGALEIRGTVIPCPDPPNLRASEAGAGNPLILGTITYNYLIATAGVPPAIPWSGHVCQPKAPSETALNRPETNTRYNVTISCQYRMQSIELLITNKYLSTQSTANPKPDSTSFNGAGTGDQPFCSNSCDRNHGWRNRNVAGCACPLHLETCL